jgi:hypothetical protein
MENFKVAEGHENDHVFVRGNTKSLSQLNASEAAVLAKNGDKRIVLAEVTVSEVVSEAVVKKNKKTEPVITDTHE